MNNKDIFAQHDLNISWKVSPDSCLVFVDVCSVIGQVSFVQSEQGSLGLQVSGFQE